MNYHNDVTTSLLIVLKNESSRRSSHTYHGPRTRWVDDERYTRKGNAVSTIHHASIRSFATVRTRGSDHTACVSTSTSALWNHNQQHHCHRCRTNPLIPVAARYWNAPENTTAASKIRNNTDYWASNNQRVVAVTTKAATMVTTSMMIMMIIAVVVNHWNVVRSILRLVLPVVIVMRRAVSPAV